MMKIPRSTSGAIKSKYEILGMRDLPFPTEAVLNPYSHDERKNGMIYAENIVRDQIDKFERLLVPKDDFPNRVRLAYVWAKGDQESGRGMGKTALLRYFRQRVNKDWGDSEFGGQFSAAVIYVSFPSQVDRRFMEQLALSALIDITKTGVLDASRAALRLGVMKPEQADAVLKDEEGEDEPGNLLNDDLLTKRGVDPAALDAAVMDKLVSEGVEKNAARALSAGTFPAYLKSFRKDGALEPLYIPRDTKILDYSRQLLFNDIVHYFRAAGFGGGYLFIDDIENLVDQMSRSERIEFAKEFGLCTVRPGYANTAFNFFSCVLTTHQQASVSLSQAWGEAGLSAIARLDPASPNSIELPLPSKDQAREIIVAHLDHYRINAAEKGSIKPFTEDGIEELLKNRQLLHPRVLLTTASKVIAHAVDNKHNQIDAAVVSKALESTAIPAATPDVTEGIEGAI